MTVWIAWSQKGNGQKSLGEQGQISQYDDAYTLQHCFDDMCEDQLPGEQCLIWYHLFFLSTLVKKEKKKDAFDCFAIFVLEWLVKFILLDFFFS